MSQWYHFGHLKSDSAHTEEAYLKGLSRSLNRSQAVGMWQYYTWSVGFLRGLSATCDNDTIWDIWYLIRIPAATLPSYGTLRNGTPSLMLTFFISKCGEVLPGLLCSLNKLTYKDLVHFPRATSFLPLWQPFHFEKHTSWSRAKSGEGKSDLGK